RDGAVVDRAGPVPAAGLAGDLRDGLRGAANCVSQPNGGATAMSAVTLEFLKENLELGEQLLAGRDSMFEPQDLPGRYGRVVKAIDHLLQLLDCVSVLG